MPLAFFLSANSPLKVRKLVQKLTVYRSCAIERSPYFLSFSKQTSLLNIPSLFYCSMHIYNISYYTLLLSGISLFVSIHSIYNILIHVQNSFIYWFCIICGSIWIEQGKVVQWITFSITLCVCVRACVRA